MNVNYDAQYELRSQRASLMSLSEGRGVAQISDYSYEHYAKRRREPWWPRWTGRADGKP